MTGQISTENSKFRGPRRLLMGIAAIALCMPVCAYAQTPKDISAVSVQPAQAWLQQKAFSGLALKKLTTAEMSGTTAQGLPGGQGPILVPPTQKPGAVILWDELGAAKSPASGTSGTAITNTVTLTIVH